MRHLLSTGIGRLADCPAASTAAISVLGLFSGSIAYTMDVLLIRLGKSGMAYAFVDAAVIGAVAALVGGLALIGVRERRRRDVEHLRSVAELNHNVRNALEVIAHSSYLSQDTHTKAVLAEVDRIDRTLRKLFPAVKVVEFEVEQKKQPQRAVGRERAAA
jgi:hypothetical protein